MNRPQQLARLLEGWLDGGLEPDEEAALLDALEHDSGLRCELAEQIATMGAAKAASDASPRWLALFDLLDEPEPGLDFETSTMESIAKLGRHRKPLRTFAWLAAAAAVLLSGLVFLAPWRNPTATRTASGGPVDTPALPVAFVLGSEGGNRSGTPVPGRFLPPGPLAMEAGWLSIQTLHGVTITLDAPFDARLVSHNRIQLDRGRARVHVPDGAEGFRLLGPDFEILDLGTEFATEVGTNGTSRCRVFKGRADVSLLDSLRTPTATRRLTASSSIRIDAKRRSMRDFDESDTDYPAIKMPPKPLLRIGPGYAAAVMALEPDCYWRFESLGPAGGVPNEAGETGPSLMLRGSAALGAEDEGNRAGVLDDRDHSGYFQSGSWIRSSFTDDWTISFFVQFDWLQNYALVSALKYSPDSKGHPFLLQAYASFGESGLDGTGLHAVIRETPAWVGGTDVFANTLFRPRVWHHVAACRKGGVMKLFLDGRLVGDTPVPGAPLDFDYFYVGRMNANMRQPWIHARTLVGRIDEMAIFPRALDDGQIFRLSDPAAGR